ncbi:MaoC family dehydratase [Nocardioides sp. AN3]
MPTHIFRSIDEVESAVGQALGTTAWMNVTQAEVDQFADVTGDRQWIHVDIERAALSPFRGTIAHGYLTLAMLPSLAQQIYVFATGSARLNYGLDKVRFPAPMPVGSQLRGTPTITWTRRVQAGTQVGVNWKIEREGGSRPVCIAESITLIVP